MTAPILVVQGRFISFDKADTPGIGWHSKVPKINSKLNLPGYRDNAAVS